MKQKILIYARRTIRKLFKVDFNNFEDDTLATLSLLSIQNDMKFYYPYAKNALD